MSHTAGGNGNLEQNKKIVNSSPNLPESATAVLKRIGNTPLLQLRRVCAEATGATILGKAEWLNPAGSVKDRAAGKIVEEAFRAGDLGDGRRLLDATSGNTGISYAMLGAACAFGVTLCMPGNVSVERKRILSAYGAEVIYTDAGEGSDGAIRKARELAAAEPRKYFYADQYSNDANWHAHYCCTGNEIWRQTRGQLTHFVAMLGTSGTFVGVTRRLRELNPSIQCVALQPDSPFHGIEGAKHMATSIVPEIYDPTLSDRNLEISTEEAHAMVRRLAREEGLLVGISAGAAVVGALRIAREDPSARIVCILPDGAEKYLSERFWDEV
ncbi:MAG TPA: cysteine synthase family protein [Bryocella sp.]|nr:cysteine synthase family protein [Bryocella sp.]